MNKNLLEIVMPASLAVVALLICGLLLAATGVLNEYAPVAVSPPEPEMGCGVVGSPSFNEAAFDTLLVPASQRAAVFFGETLFKGNCAQCHALNEVVVGPALAGITKRRPMSWLIPWIKNSGKLIASGDDYAVKIYEQYQQQQMPSFQLSDEEITQILDYVQAVEGQGTGLAAN